MLRFKIIHENFYYHMCRFKAFHERYYHPSNARFWFYGDDPPQERLRLLAAFLDNFDARPVDSTVKPQPLFSVCFLACACQPSQLSIAAFYWQSACRPALFKGGRQLWRFL